MLKDDPGMRKKLLNECGDRYIVLDQLLHYGCVFRSVMENMNLYLGMSLCEKLAGELKLQKEALLIDGFSDTVYQVRPDSLRYINRLHNVYDRQKMNSSIENKRLCFIAKQRCEELRVESSAGKEAIMQEARLLQWMEYAGIIINPHLTPNRMIHPYESVFYTYEELNVGYDLISFLEGFCEPSEMLAGIIETNMYRIHVYHLNETRCRTLLRADEDVYRIWRSSLANHQFTPRLKRSILYGENPEVFRKFVLYCMESPMDDGFRQLYLVGNNHETASDISMLLSGVLAQRSMELHERRGWDYPEEIVYRTKNQLFQLATRDHVLVADWCSGNVGMIIDCLRYYGDFELMCESWQFPYLELLFPARKIHVIK